MYPNGGVGQSGAPVVFSGLSFARGLGNNTIFDFFGAFSIQVIVELALLLKSDLLLQAA